MTLLNSSYCYTLFLVISFAQCKEYMILQISFTKFLDALPALTDTSEIFEAFV